MGLFWKEKNSVFLRKKYDSSSGVFFFFFFADHLFFQFSGKKLQAQCSLRTLHSVSNCCTDCCHHCGCGVKDSEKYVGESEIIIMTTKVIVAVEKKEFIFQQ